MTFYFLIFGSKASRTPSPTRFSRDTVTNIAIPGARVRCQAPVAYPSLKVCPHDGTEASPNPKKDKVLSVRIAEATPNVALTRTGPNALGNMC